jgi:hypothetical protein
MKQKTSLFIGKKAKMHPAQQMAEILILVSKIRLK